MEDMLVVQDLVKHFGDVKAVDGISFRVPAGSLYAFLGPNGAGKSTTIHCICTLLQFDSGSIVLNGYQAGMDDDGIRNSIGVVFQESLLDAALTVRENLMVRASMYGIFGDAFKQRLSEVMEAIDIGDFIDQRYGQLSGGQRRRADIARGLIHAPTMLFLDEPTTGLDPQTRASVWDSIKRMQSETGVTVFLTTHYMEEAARADLVAVMDYGKLIAEDRPSVLRKQYSTHKLRLYFSDEAHRDNIEQYLIQHGFASISMHGTHMTVGVQDGAHALQTITGVQDDIADFELVRGSMDDVFLALTGREIRQEGGEQ
ncbi:ATP-binding cassette domain-containing protein [Eubacteriales bacterium OttesenSCG-928-N14]|nr:ATP-binding cassette domain-containing protein [Eubacteriales bacterium OttesenSCG-928-N14]